uniref:Uncharacterized protein n=1 Tax=Adiantum shastense TaxID=2052490 RepID=A0A2P1MBI3_9MONI|nr:hypothetical protein [Adiantum shastense]AVP32750.1 hypothetical protein [Adiantum shastense]
MGLVCRYFQMFLYYPSFFLLLYLYVVFVIPSRSIMFRKDYWFYIKTYFGRADVGEIFRNAMNKWDGGGGNER